MLVRIVEISKSCDKLYKGYGIVNNMKSGMFVLVGFFVLLGFVGAEDVIELNTLDNNPTIGVSDGGVEYDGELIGQFFLSKWIHVMVDAKDFSNITINYKEDSVEIQTMKDNQRWEIYRNTSNAVLSTLSKDEFRLKQKSEFGVFFSGNITKEGFDKLLNDTRVRKIYAKKNWKAYSGSIIKSFFIYVVPIILLISLIIALIKLKKKKWKVKR